MSWTTRFAAMWHVVCMALVTQMVAKSACIRLAVSPAAGTDSDSKE